MKFDMKKILKSTALLIAYLFLSSSPVFSDDIPQYGLVQGTTVYIRSEPQVNSDIAEILANWDVVTIIEKSREKCKIDEDLYYWYKVKTEDEKIGWVYGKYIILMNKKPRSDNYYRNIIWSNLEKEAETWDGYIDVKIKYLSGRGLYKFNFWLFVNDLEADGSQYLYKINGDSLRLVLVTLYVDSIVFHDNYIIVISEAWVLRVYDTNQMLPERANIIKERLNSYCHSYDSYYKKTYEFHMAHYRKEHDLSGANFSYIEFDKEEMVFYIHIKNSRDGPVIRSEKYIFESGKFVLEE